MAEVGTVYVSVMPSTKGFTKTLGAQGQAGGITAGNLFSKSFGTIVSGSALGNILSNVFTKVSSTISSSMGAAVSRVDTLNNFPKVMQNLGYGADEAEVSINRLSAGIDGLPTSLDGIVSMTQQLAPLCGGMERATTISLAMNNMFLASGASTADQTRAMQQYTQMLSRGNVELNDWRTLQEVMPGQLNQVAQALLGPTKNSTDLYDALKKGKVTMDDFNNAVIKLNSEGVNGFASFEEQARTATEGIGTAAENMQNRAGKSIGKVIDHIGQANISGAINNFSSGFTVIADRVIEIWDGITSRIDFAGFESAFGGVRDVLKSVFSEGNTAASFGEQVGGMINMLIPAIQAATPLIQLLAIGFKFAAENAMWLVPAIILIMAAFKFGSLIGTAGSSLQFFGGAAAAATPNIAANASQMLRLGVAVLAFGAGILLACAGVTLLVFTAIQLADAGNMAYMALFSLVAVLAVFAIGLAVLGPILTANAIGIAVFGAAVIAVGLGVMLVCAGITLLSLALPALSANGLSAAVAIAALGLGMLAAAPGAMLLGAALLVCGVGGLVAGAAFLAMGVGLLLAGTGILLVSAGLRMLVAVLPLLASKGLEGSVALVAIGAAMLAAAPGALALGAALVTLGLGLTACAAGMMLLAVGSMLASAGLALLGVVLPAIVSIGAPAAVAIAQLGLGMLAAAPGALALGAALVVMGAGLSACAIGMTLLALGSMLASAGLGLLSAVLPSLIAVSASGTATITSLGIAMLAASPGAFALGAALLVCGVGALVAAAGLIALTAGCMGAFVGLMLCSIFLATMTPLLTQSGMDAAILGAALLIVAASSFAATPGLLALAACIGGVAIALGLAVPAFSGLAGALGGSASALSTCASSMNTIVMCCMLMTSSAAMARAGLILIGTGAIMVQGQLSSAASRMSQTTQDLAFRIQANMSRIQNTFNGMRLHIPSPTLGKMPHFSLSGKFDLQAGTVPSINVNWYKTGGVFTHPSIVGLAEAGTEVVYPLDRLKSDIADAVASGSSQEIDMSGVEELLWMILQAIPRLSQRDLQRQVRGMVNG